MGEKDMSLFFDSYFISAVGDKSPNKIKASKTSMLLIF